MSSETLGGYRLVRKLGEGLRAEVHLGYPVGTDSPPAAIKHYRAGVSQQSVLTEIEALSRAWGEHVVELLDLSTADDAASALLLQRLPGVSLARLLQERSSIRLGEAITILAPLATTISRLHASGVAHGALTAHAVLFDASGSPVLVRFGSACLIPVGMSAAALQAEPLIAADLAALQMIVSQVLGAAHHDDAAALARWFTARVMQAPERAADELADRLFASAAAEPVSFSEQFPAIAPLPNRVVTAEPIVDMPSRRALPAWLSRAAQQLAKHTAFDLAWIPRVRTTLATIRPRLWVIAGAVALALVAAVLLVPSEGSDALPQASAPSESEPPTPSATASPTPSPVTGDDPVAALLALLAARARCIHDLSVLCLDAVAEAGSSALAADQQQISELQSGGEVSVQWDIRAIALNERLGDSALVTVDDPEESEPASFLLVKGEAGWRIRDYLWR